MLLRGGASPTVGTVEPSATAWLCPGSTPLHIAAALNHRDVCQALFRWQRRSRNSDDLGNVRNEMGLKPSQCAMLAGHYTLASELLQMQSATHTTEPRRRRRHGGSRRRADGPPAHAGGSGELTRETMLAMMHRAQLLVQLQTLADDERRGMAALRHQLGEEEGGTPTPAAPSNPELVLLRNTIHALQEALQVGALPAAQASSSAPTDDVQAEPTTRAWMRSVCAWTHCS